MLARRCRSLLILLFAALPWLAGCVGGTSNPSYFPWVLPSGDIVRTHAKPPGEGYFEDFDPHARRLDVRPMDASMPIGKQLLLIASVYDEKDNARRKRRVEWIVEGPGSIVEVDESGILPGRGYKVDNKYAVTYTDFFEHNLPKGIDNPLGQVIKPGQTWCVVSCAVEGQTVVTAYAPEIADADRNRVLVNTHWVDARWQFPKAAAAKAGTEYVFTTQVNRHTSSEPVTNYRVRYTILDGTASTGIYLVSAPKNGAQRSVTVATDADGNARVNVAELKPEFGANRIGIEVLKPDPNEPGRFVVVAKSETKIDWMAPGLKLSVDAPASSQVNQAFPVTYSVVSTGSVATMPIMLKTVVPDGWTVVSADPTATADGNELLWPLPALPGGKQQTVQVVFKPTKTGKASFTSTARTTDNMRDDKTSTVQITEGRLDITIAGPQAGLVGENLPYLITVKNPGTGPVINVKITAQFDAGLGLAGNNGVFAKIIDKLEAGQTQNISLRLVPKQEGRSAVKALATADANLRAESTALAVDVKKPDLKVEVLGPPRGYLNQDVTWTIRVFNPSDLPLADVKVRALLPPEVAFSSASNDGKFLNNAVEWTIGTSVGKQFTDLTLTTVCKMLSSKAVVTATFGGTPLDKRNGEFKPVALTKPVGSDQKAEASIEILGVPALQLEVSDSPDPVQVGQKVTYTLKVKNAGTIQANQVEIAAELPVQTRAVQTTGVVKGKIDGQKVVFPAIAAIKPGETCALTIEADAVSEGDGRLQVDVKSLALVTPIHSEEPTRVIARNDVPVKGR